MQSQYLALKRRHWPTLSLLEHLTQDDKLSGNYFSFFDLPKILI